MTESDRPVVIEVGDAEFEEKVLAESNRRTVVVDFYADWCRPCQELSPLLERLAAERKGEFLLAKVNVDQNQNLATVFRVEGIPAVRAIRAGQIVGQFEGLLPESQLRQFIADVLPSEADRLVAEAAGLEATNPARAEKLYRQALASPRVPDAARIGLARLRLARGDEAEARELLQAVPPGGPDAEDVIKLTAQLQLRQAARELPDEATLRARVAAEPDNARLRYFLGSVLAAAGRYSEALAELLAAAELDRELAGKEVREAMVTIFKAVGVRSELADAYRDKLQKLLY
jgi:putative thioredoxin